MERERGNAQMCRKKAHKQPKCKRPYTRELAWAACGCIWGDIWDKITPGFTVKSSFHLRNKEDSKSSICAPCKCSCNCHGRARHKPRDFQNLKGKVAANALDISVTLFYTIDLENSTFILTRRGAEAILFLTKSWNRQQQHDRKIIRAQSHQPSWMAHEVHSINYLRT